MRDEQSPQRTSAGRLLISLSLRTESHEKWISSSGINCMSVWEWLEWERKCSETVVGLDLMLVLSTARPAVFVKSAWFQRLHCNSKNATCWQNKAFKSEFKFRTNPPHLGYLNPGADPGFDEEGSDKRPPKAVAPRGYGGMLPRKIFNVMASEMRFPAFSGAIWSGLIALKSSPFLC